MNAGLLCRQAENSEPAATKCRGHKTLLEDASGRVNLDAACRARRRAPNRVVPSLRVEPPTAGGRTRIGVCGLVRDDNHETEHQ